MSITFSCPLETLPLSFSVIAVRFYNVLCCVVKLMKMFSDFSCVLFTCMCFLKLQCVELSGPPCVRLCEIFVRIIKYKFFRCGQNYVQLRINIYNLSSIVLEICPNKLDGSGEQCKGSIKPRERAKSPCFIL